MEYQDSYLESCWKKNIGKFAFGKKREVVEKIINYLARRYEEDLARYIVGRKIERNPWFLSMKKGGEKNDF